MIKPVKITSIFFLLYTICSAQFTENTLVGRWLLADTTYNSTDTLVISRPFRTFNIRSLGMGNTVVTNGITYNGMMDNPALLSRKRRLVNPLSVRAMVVSSTIDALNFISDNRYQINQSTYLKDIYEGIFAYIPAAYNGTQKEREDAVERINSGIIFVQQLLDTLSGDIYSTKHGISALGRIQGQWDNWGLSIISEVQSTILASPGETLLNLSKQPLTTNSGGYISDQAYAELLNVILATVDKNGTLKGDALPKILGIATADLIMSVGYAHDFRDWISLGVNINAISRKYGIDLYQLGVYSPENMQSSMQDAFTGNSHWYFNADLGALFTLQKTNLELGIAFQNIIPYKGEILTYTIYHNKSSTTQMVNENGEQLYGYYDFGDQFLYITDPSHPQAKALVEYTDIPQVTHVPLQLSMPPNLAIGGSWYPFDEKLVLAFELKDLLFLDNATYDTFIHRISIGLEYNPFNFLALRTGIFSSRPTLGASLFTQFNRVNAYMDYSWIFDRFSSERALLLQLGLTVSLEKKNPVTGSYY